MNPVTFESVTRHTGALDKLLTLGFLALPRHVTPRVLSIDTSLANRIPGPVVADHLPLGPARICRRSADRLKG